MRKVAVRRPGGHDQKVIRDLAILGADDLAVAIDRMNVGENDCRVGLPAQYAADRRGDVGRRQARGRHLIEQRLEQMVVVPIDHHDVDRRLGERLRGREPAKSCADDDDPLARLRGGPRAGGPILRRLPIDWAERSARRVIKRSAR